MLPSADQAVQQLTDPAFRTRAGQFVGGPGHRHPGLYAWFVDDAGAAELSGGLAAHIDSGLIYAGQAGAGGSSATLASRIVGNHLGGSTYGSTLRFTLACALQGPLGVTGIGKRRIDGASERRLTEWMRSHLSVATVAYDDREGLDAFETLVVERLDPPLNLRKVDPTPVRTELSRRRASLSAMATSRAPSVRTSKMPSTAHQKRSAPAPGLTSRAAAPELSIVVTVDATTPSSRIDARELLGRLAGTTIYTLTGRPNQVLGIEGQDVIVATDKSPEGKPVPVEWVQAALDRLIDEERVTINVASVGYRSAFIGAVLSTVPGAIAAKGEVRLPRPDSRPPTG